MVERYRSGEDILEIPYDYLLMDRDKSWLVRINTRDAFVDVFVPKSKAEIFPNDENEDRGGILTMGQWIAEQLQVESYAK